jgi:hypothetical protein
MIDHGTWTGYKPVNPPEDFPMNALYAKRDSDNVDWYEYVRGDHFKENSIKLTVRIWKDGGPVIVSAPQLKAEHLFPAGHRVVEIEGNYSHLDEEALIKKFAGKIIDLKTGKISDPPPIEMPENKELADIIARLEKLEAKR